MAERKTVTIYTDGGCIDNPGPGGYGVVLIYGAHRRELFGGFRLTTNNRMEIMAAIAGLSALKESCRVTLISDSQYLVNAIEQGWAARWRENGWRRSRKEMALNPDLWEQLLDLCEKHRVTFKWVRGHAGNEENERCDQLAQAMARSPDLPPDLEYERTIR
jgi:ribonuclease HI